jgi:hypothetical protein
VIKPNWALCVIEKTKIPLNHTEIVAAAKLLVEIRNELQDDLGAYAVAMRDQYGDEKLREFAHDIAHDALYTGSWLANYRLKVNAACRRGRRWPLPWEPAGPRKRTERTAWKQHPERAGAIHSAARNKILARFRSAPFLRQPPVGG